MIFDAPSLSDEIFNLEWNIYEKITRFVFETELLRSGQKCFRNKIAETSVFRKHFNTNEVIQQQPHEY